MRVATYNLASGRSAAGAQLGPGELQEAVACLDADVLAVQEVDRAQPRSAGADQLGLTAAAMGATEARFVATVLGTPGPRWAWRPATDDEAGAHPTGPAYGVGLLTRRPVVSWHVLRFPAARGWLPVAVPAPGRHRPRLVWVPDEPRAAVAAVLKTPRMTVVGTHLSFVPGANARQLWRLRRWLLALPRPWLVLGDLNLPGRVPAVLTGWTPLVSGRTYPWAEPRVQLDHVLAAGLTTADVRGGEVLALGVGDHRAVAVTVSGTGVDADAARGAGTG